MDRFVCVRVVQGWGLDLSLFQFDWRATWSVFLMNGDRAVYGRFDARQWHDVEGLRKAMEGALELHRRYPANKEELAGKVGPALPWKRAEDLPAIQERGKYRRVTGMDGCVHCHNVLEGVTRSYGKLGVPVPERFLAPYPTPQWVGLTLDPKECATVMEVQAHSPAERALLKAGDRIVRFAGQPLLSSADFAWVLWSAPDAADLPLLLDRKGEEVRTTLKLPQGWRTR